jgi:ArsR family transcriptional regulator
VQDFIKTTKALSDETRLRILNLLMERECCVCEVMQALNISQTRASRNLGILENAGFLKSRRDGMWILYSMDKQTGKRYTIPLANLIKDKAGDDPVFVEDRERLQKAVRLGHTCVNK